MSDRVKFTLDEQEIPRTWTNLLPDLPEPPPPPPLHPGTRQPVGPDDLAPLFAPGLIAQEVSPEPEIEIPDRVAEAYKLWRPTPLYRARRLERELDTPAHIYYKYEGVSPAGSHKPNTAVAQAYENATAGIKKLTTETGAGQWGSALELRPEALPPLDDGGLGRDGAPLAVRGDRRGALPAGAPNGLAGDRDL
jgi:tryptophan synthase beta chain